MVLIPKKFKKSRFFFNLIPDAKQNGKYRVLLGNVNYYFVKLILKNQLHFAFKMKRGNSNLKKNQKNYITKYGF